MRGRKKAGMESRSPFYRLELKQTHHFRWGFSPLKTIRRKSRCLLSALEGVASRLGFVKPVALLSYSNQSQPQRTTSLSSAPGSSLSRSSPPHLFTSNRHSWFIFDRTHHSLSLESVAGFDVWRHANARHLRIWSPGLHMAWYRLGWLYLDVKCVCLLAYMWRDSQKKEEHGILNRRTLLAHSQLASLLWFSDTHLSQQKSEDLTAIFLKYLQWSQSTCSLFMFFIKSSDTASFDLKKKIF